MEHDQLFPTTEGMLGKTGQQVVLILDGKRGQMKRHRRSYVPNGELLLRFLGQFSRESGTLDDPGLLSPQKLGDCRSGHAILRKQGINDPPFIQGGQSAMGCIGLQETTFVFRLGTWRFDHHGNGLALFLHPDGEPFEAINDLETAVVISSDAERQGLEIAIFVITDFSRSKAVVARS